MSSVATKLDPNRISDAITDWRAALSPESVLTGEAARPYLANCLSMTRSVPAALKPEDEVGVQKAVQIASRHLIRLYAFSTGHNWGYGTSLPVEDECVILDLSRMNRILDMDRELGLITLQPGVTQRVLADYLKQSGLDFFVPTTGAGPSASIIGNALERGFGIAPEEDHFGAVRSLRAVLPDGTVYESSRSSIGLPLSQSCWKWGIGPYLDGLFAQGNFGIVTAMTIALRRRPEHMEAYVFSLKAAGQLPDFVCRCREALVHLHGIAGGIKLMNQAEFGMYRMDSRELGMGVSPDFAWVGFGVLHTPRSMIRQARASLKKIMKGSVSQIVFLDENRIRRFRALAKCMPGALGKRLSRQVQQGIDILQIVRGEPRALELRLVYQHVPLPPGGPEDPIKDGVGVMWYAPVIPLKADSISKMMAAINTTLGSFGFPEAVTLTVLDQRCAIAVVPIIYKRPDDRERAHQCFHSLWEEGKKAGCFPYRINIAAMPKLAQQGENFWRLAKIIKAAVDPHGLFSPGRYGL